MLYIIHPTLALDIRTKNKHYLSYFRNEYERVSVFNNIENVNKINVNLVSQLPKYRTGDRLKECRFKKIFNYSYLIRGLETSTVDIYFKDLFAGKIYPKNVTLFLQTQLLEPIIYFKLLQQNILFMHSAGVSDGKYGYLFPACGGTGKTTLTLGLMAEGLEVLGDDLLIVEPGKNLVHAYLRPLHIFTYNIKTLRGATIPMSIRVKVKVKNMLRAILEKITSQEFLISTRVHADTIYSNFRPAKTVPYRKMCFLKKTGDHEDIAITKSNIGDLARKILASGDLNQSLYLNILNPPEKADVEKLELKVISNVLKNLTSLQFINTRRLDFRNLKGFKNELIGP